MALKHPFSTVEVAQKFIEGVVRLHGFPKSIVSDRDRIFISTFWMETFRLAETQLKYSTAFHPQTNGQSEVLNRCLEGIEPLLRNILEVFCLTTPSYLVSLSELGQDLVQYFVYITPFQVLYGREPPALVRFEEGSTKNFELEVSLRERDLMLKDIKLNLERAQQLMKKSADRHRRDVEFEVGSQVYLKLKPYIQQSVQRKVCQKLAAKLFGPFAVVARVDKAAYKLTLPSSSKIHPVFHVSQLKAVVGSGVVVNPLPLVCLEELESPLQQVDVLAKRYDNTGALELLIQWSESPSHDNSWMLFDEFVKVFPFFKPEDKLGFKGGSIDKYRKAYVRKGKRGGVREVEEQLYSNLEGDFEKSNLEDDVEELSQVEKGVKTLA
ncbi:hypothetical protein YC2023_081565 [Brassica napus]